jgi:hypothetical protein
VGIVEFVRAREPFTERRSEGNSQTADSGSNELLHRLRQDGANLSRNRNFEYFEDPAARQTLRHYQRILRLEKDLLACARQGTVRLCVNTLALDGSTHSLIIEMEIPALRFKRQVFLEEQELRMLREKPVLAALLEQ